MPVVGLAQIKVVPTFTDAQKSIGKEMGKAGDSSSVESAGSKIGGGLKKAAIAGVAGTGALLGTALVKGLGRLQAIENAKAKLTGLGHSAKGVELIMTNATAAVKGTAFGLGDAATVAAGAVAAGVKPGKDLERTLKLTGDAATIAGVGMGEMGAIFNKVASSNKIQGDVIAQLNDSGIPIIQLLSKELGKSAEETVKLASKGKINFETFQAAMEKGMGGAALKSGETFQGALANVGAALGRIGETLLEPFYGAAKAGMNVLIPALDSINAALKPVLQSFADAGVAMAKAFDTGKVSKGSKGVLRFLESIAVTTGKVFKEVEGGFVAMVAAFKAGDGDITSKGFAGVLEAIGGIARAAKDAFAPAFKDVWAALKPVIKQGYDLATQFSPFAVIVRTLTPLMPQIADAFKALAGALADVLTAVIPMVAEIARVLVPVLKDLVSAVLPPLLVFIVQMAKVAAALAPAIAVVAGAWGAWRVGLKLWSAALWVATKAQQAFNFVMGLSPLAKVLTLIGLLTTAIVWLYQNNQTAREIIDGAFKAIGDVIGWLWNNVAKPVFGFIGDAFGGMVSGINDLWNGVLKPAFDAIGGFFGGLVGLVSGVVGGVVTAWKGMTDGIAAAWSWVVGAVKVGWDVLAYIFEVFKAIAETIYELWIGPALQAIGSAWGGMVNGIKSLWDGVLKPVWDAVAAAARWLWNSVLNVVFNAIKAGWQFLVNTIRAIWTGVLKPVWDAVANGAKWLWSNVLSPVFGRIKAGWSAMVDGIKWVWNNVLKPAWDSVRQAAGFLRDALGKAFGTVKSLWDGMVNGIKSLWETKLKPVFDGLISVVKDSVVGAFEGAKKAIDSIWKDIANIVRVPVNFVIDTVYNDGLKALFNGVAEKLGLGWRLPDVGGIPAFADGGLAKKGWALVGEEGPELVNFSSPGRVYTASETQAMLAGKEQAPEAALPMLAGSKAADSVLPVGGFWADVWNNAKKAVGDGFTAAKDWVVGRIADGVRTMTQPLKNGITSMLPGGGFNELIRGSALNLIDDMTSWAIKKDDAKEAEQIAAGTFDGGGAGGEFGASGAIYQGALGAFHRPSAGPYTSMFGPRWGGFHAGVDIAGGGPTFAALSGKVDRVGWNAVPGRTGIAIVLNHGPGLWTYYGHNPSMGAVKVRPGQDVKAGQHIGQQGATGNVTGTHLHFEVHKGRIGAAVNPMAYLHDQGGYLQPGLSLLRNATRKPEPVLNHNQWSDIHRLAMKNAGTGGGDTYQFGNVGYDPDEIIRRVERQKRRAMALAG